MIESLAPATAGVTLTNARSRQVIARDVELALTRAARRQGLLKRPAMPRDTALLLAPCFMVHTAFMQFAIDLIFVDRRGYVRRVVSNVRPWRMAASPRAYATIELPAGTLAQHDVAVGDRLCLGVAMAALRSHERSESYEARSAESYEARSGESHEARSAESYERREAARVP